MFYRWQFEVSNSRNVATWSKRPNESCKSLDTEQPPIVQFFTTWIQESFVIASDEGQMQKVNNHILTRDSAL